MGKRTVILWEKRPRPHICRSARDTSPRVVDASSRSHPSRRARIVSKKTRRSRRRARFTSAASRPRGDRSTRRGNVSVRFRQLHDEEERRRDDAADDRGRVAVARSDERGRVRASTRRSRETARDGGEFEFVERGGERRGRGAETRRATRTTTTGGARGRIGGE